MARLSSFARRLRAQAEAEGRQVFFWDAGDAADRREKICRATKGAAISPILNAMGYSLQTLGNDLALPYGPQVMQAVAARAQFPILGANFRNGHDALPAGLSECALVPLANGFQLGVFGLTAPWDGLYKVFGLDFPDSHEIAREMVTRLRNDGASTIILLSHLGLADDRQLAENVQGIDVIIGAHSHDLLPHGEIHENVLIAQAGNYAEHLGRVDLTLDERGCVAQRSARVLPVPSDVASDPLVLQAVAEAEREVAALLAQPIGSSTVALELDYFNECLLGACAADALREHMHAEVAVLAGAHFQQGLPRGTITRGDLNDATLSTANPYVTLLPGSQLRAVLERGLDPAITEHKHTGFRGPPMGILQISGLRVEYRAEAATGSRVQRIWIEDVPLRDEQFYRVAHTDGETIATSDDVAYFSADGLESRGEVPTIVGEVLESYFAKHSPLPAPVLGRWQRVAHV